MKGYADCFRKMTKNKNKSAMLLDPTAPISDFGIEVRRLVRGASVSVSGAISVFELSDGEVGILTKRARVNIVGKGLKLTVFEARRVVVDGVVEGVNLRYGKG